MSLRWSPEKRMSQTLGDFVDWKLKLSARIMVTILAELSPELGRMWGARGSFVVAVAA